MTPEKHTLQIKLTADSLMLCCSLSCSAGFTFTGTAPLNTHGSDGQIQFMFREMRIVAHDIGGPDAQEQFEARAKEFMAQFENEKPKES